MREICLLIVDFPAIFIGRNNFLLLIVEEQVDQHAICIYWISMALLDSLQIFFFMFSFPRPFFLQSSDETVETRAEVFCGRVSVRDLTRSFTNRASAFGRAIC